MNDLFECSVEGIDEINGYSRGARRNKQAGLVEFESGQQRRQQWRQPGRVGLHEAARPAATIQFILKFHGDGALAFE